MALEGELKDFNILEVIQLLGQQGKTGVLRVSGLGKKGGEAEIFFLDGKLTHATSTERPTGDLLGERLAKTGIISRSDLQTALRSGWGAGCPQCPVCPDPRARLRGVSLRGGKVQV